MSMAAGFRGHRAGEEKRRLTVRGGGAGIIAYDNMVVYKFEHLKGMLFWDRSVCTLSVLGVRSVCTGCAL